MNPRRLARIWRFALVLVLIAGLIAPVQAADASLVFAALKALKDNHVDSPDPVKLVVAAVGGLRQALARAGINEPLADLQAGDEAGATAEFQARFDQSVALAQGRIGESQLQYAAAEAMAASLGDSHTRFFTPEEYRALVQSLQGRAGYVGIGIVLLRQDGRYYIWHAIRGGPAALSGVRGLDRIVAIDGESVEGMAPEAVSERIRGPRGTTVRLTVQRPGEYNPRTLAIVRELIAVPAMDFSMLERQIGYVRFLDINQGSAEQLRRALGELQRQEMRGLVLDLRHNPGGLTAELNEIADALLPSGATVYIAQGRQGRAIQIAAGIPALLPTVPLVLVVNALTRSAAEVLSAAILDNGRGRIVGTRTGGAVLNTRFMPLPGGAAIGVPIWRMLSPKAVDLEGNGVTPDVPTEMSTDDLDRGVDTQLLRAVGLAAQSRAFHEPGPIARVPLWGVARLIPSPGLP